MSLTNSHDASVQPPDQRLAEYFADAAPTAGPYWTAAASSAAIKADLKKLPDGGSLSSTPVLNLNQPTQFIQRPPTSDELLAWGNSISSKQVPHLLFIPCIVFKLSLVYFHAVPCTYACLA